MEINDLSHWRHTEYAQVIGVYYLVWMGQPRVGKWQWDSKMKGTSWQEISYRTERNIDTSETEVDQNPQGV